MLEIANLEPSNIELNDKETQEVYGGVISGLGSVAVTTADIGLRAYFRQSLDGYYFTSQAQRAAILAGLGFAFGGPKGAALDS